MNVRPRARPALPAGNESIAYVTHMHHRAPRRTVALDFDAAVVYAHATRLLKTISQRRRGLAPNTGRAETYYSEVFIN